MSTILRLMKKAANKKAPRNPVAVAMKERYPRSQVFSHKAEPRGGDKNEQQELLEEVEEEELDDELP